MIMEAKMSDYQEVEGLYMPFSMSQGVKDQPGQPLTITSIELNVQADDSEFKFPESNEAIRLPDIRETSSDDDGDGIK